MLLQLDPIAAEILKLAELLAPVDHETLGLDTVAGRVLAQPLAADRDNPPLNVSAMDGYAVRLTDVAVTKRLPIAGIATAGAPAPQLLAGHAVQIFTGAPVPSDADCVVPREQTLESPTHVEIISSELRPGMHVRYQGENARAGSQVLSQGTLLTSAAIAGVASVSGPTLPVFRPVRVAILNTGDELVPPGQPAQPWQIRDSNGPTLEAALSQHRWLTIVARRKVRDDLQSVVDAIGEYSHADAIILTGGVSMGDTDHVPKAIEQSGGRIIFHRLPIRPGKPVLGAVLDQQLIVGLPGNPVSVAVTTQVIALPLLRRLAGMAQLLPACPRVTIANADDKQLKLQWYRLVSLRDDGQAEYLDNRGSGDLVSLARSHGFVKLPAGQTGTGPWELMAW